MLRRLLERLNHAIDTRLADMFDTDLGNLDTSLPNPEGMCLRDLDAERKTDAAQIVRNTAPTNVDPHEQ